MHLELDGAPDNARTSHTESDCSPNPARILTAVRQLMAGDAASREIKEQRLKLTSHMAFLILFPVSLKQLQNNEMKYCGFYNTML